jgi:hypothetical protein
VRYRKAFLPWLFLGLTLVLFAGWPSQAEAQARGPVRSPVAVSGGYYHYPVVRYPVGPYYRYPGPYYSYPYYPYYSPFYFSWSFGTWYQYPYAYAYPYPYAFPYMYPAYAPYGYPDLTASIRLEVTPRSAEVYVDGHRAGSVDNFDGFFQRLRVAPGEHEIVLYLDGYRTVRQKLNLSSGSDQKVQYTMVRLAAGEQADPRPAEPPPDEPQNPQPYPPRQGESPQGVPRNPAPTEPGQNLRFGSVSIRVQPADAEILVDGQRWSAPETQDRLVVELSEGRHHVEVQKEGFERYSSDIQVRRGETVTLNISLLKAAGTRPTHVSLVSIR